MSQKLKLSISQPCHENWQQMNPTEKGKFCNACAKEVVDFTAMSDSEVLNYFTKPKSENTCGRFYQDQLNREIVKPVYTAKKISWYWNYLVMLFMLLFKSEASKSQTIIKPIKIEQLSNVNQSCSITLGGVVAGVSVVDVIFNGQVVGEKGELVRGATVQVKGTNNITSSDENGRYSLKDVESEDVLQISAVGYCTREVKARSNGNQVTVLKETVSGAVVVGGFSADYDYTPAAAPTYVAVIEVRDDRNSEPVKATIRIENLNEDDEEERTATTNKKGAYKLRQIGSRDLYRLSITAEGYNDQVLNINGWKFNDRKETRHVFLKRIETVPTENRRIILGGAQTSFNERMYIVDGLLSSADKVKEIKPEDIERIDVLKDAASVALYGRQASEGIILITTKKHHTTTTPTVVAKDKLQTKIADKKPDSKIIDDFKIAPNPVVKGNAFSLSFKAASAGEYSLRIFDASGVLLKAQEFTVTQKQHTMQLQTNANWASGVYHIAVTDSKGKLLQVANFMLQ